MLDLEKKLIHKFNYSFKYLFILTIFSLINCIRLDEKLNFYFTSFMGLLLFVYI